MTPEEVIESGRPLLVCLMPDEIKHSIPGETEQRPCEVCGRIVSVHESSLPDLARTNAVVVCSDDAREITALDPERNQARTVDDLSADQLAALREVGMSDEQINLALQLAHESVAPRRWTDE